MSESGHTFNDMRFMSFPVRSSGMSFDSISLTTSGFIIDYLPFYSVLNDQVHRI